MTQEMELLKSFEGDSNWFYENVDSIRDQGFINKFVAVKNKQVISSGDEIDSLINSLESKGENPSYIFIEFVHSEGFTLIL